MNGTRRIIKLSPSPGLQFKIEHGLPFSPTARLEYRRKSYQNPMFEHNHYISTKSLVTTFRTIHRAKSLLIN